MSIKKYFNLYNNSMDGKEAVGVLKTLLEIGKLDEKETEAVQTAVGSLSFYSQS
jgi:hypothetical protein